MKRIIIFIVSVVSAVSCMRPAGYVTITGYAQGGTYSVRFNMEGVDVEPEEIRDSIEAVLRSVDSSLSGYNRNSLLSRFNEGERIVPDEIFLDMYEKAYQVYDDTDGVVDAASAPLFDIWGFGFRSGEMPDADRVREVMSGCGMDRLVRNVSEAVSPDGYLSASALPVDRAGIRPELNYNAIAQGYSCDLVARYLYGIGVRDMMVNIGEIFCDGLNPDGLPWTIGIDRPTDGNNEPGADVQAVFRVPSGPHGVVTSGNYRKFYVRDGRKYAHTVDPRTGCPVSHNLLSATILAHDALAADAWATYCMVVGLDKSIEFIQSDPEVEGCLIYDDGGVFRIWCSEGMELR